MAETPDTDNFGLTRISEGEQLSKNGFAALDSDRVTLDDLLRALSQHVHDGSERLADPVGAPSLIARGTGGTLPPDTTLYYRFSFLDRWGLETAGSSESYITTAQSLAAPSSLAANMDAANGLLSPGLYSYVATYGTPEGGETTPGPRTDVRTVGGTARVRLDLPDLAPGAASVRIYRARPGQQSFYFLLETDEEFVYDDGSLSEDPTITTPGFNSTGSTNSVEVSLPDDLPTTATGWRLYRSVTPGTYSGTNLVHTVVEGITDQDETIRTSWVDRGEGLERGEPRETSATLGGGLRIGGGGGDAGTDTDGDGVVDSYPRPISGISAFGPGALDSGEVITEFYLDRTVAPTSISAYFKDAPVKVLDSHDVSAQVALRAVDEYGHTVWLNTGSNHLPDVNGQRYFSRAYPKTRSGALAAETGTRSGTAPIQQDTSALDAQVVELNDLGESVDLRIGVLDAGEYKSWLRVRRVDTGTPVEDDIVLEVFETTGDHKRRLIKALTVTDTAFVEYGPFRFGSGPGAHVQEGGFAEGARTTHLFDTVDFPLLPNSGTDLTFRVSKVTGAPAVYYVDEVRYEIAEPQVLGPGRVRIYADVADPAGRRYRREASEVVDGERVARSAENLDKIGGGINGTDYIQNKAVDSRWPGLPDNHIAGTLMFLSSDTRPMHTQIGFFKVDGDRLIAAATDMDKFWGNQGHFYEAWVDTNHSTLGFLPDAGGQAWTDAFRITPGTGQTAAQVEANGGSAGGYSPGVSGVHMGGLVTLTVNVDWSVMQPGEIQTGLLSVRSRATDAQMANLFWGSEGYDRWRQAGGAAVAVPDDMPNWRSNPALVDTQFTRQDPDTFQVHRGWGFDPWRYDGTDDPTSNPLSQSIPGEHWTYWTSMMLVAVKALDNMGGNVNVTLTF